MDIPHISVTKDYEQFTFQAGNRTIDDQNLRLLKRRIRKRNLLRYFPILVTPSGIIVDGQHRFIIARQLKLAIYYLVMSKEEEIELTADINSSSSTWELEDYLTALASKYPDYNELELLLERYPKLNLKTILAVLGYSKVVGINKFKKGEFIFEAVLKKLARESSKLDHSYSMTFLRALKNSIDDSTYKLPKKVIKASSVQGYYEQLSK